MERRTVRKARSWRSPRAPIPSTRCVPWASLQVGQIQQTMGLPVVELHGQVPACCVGSSPSACPCHPAMLSPDFHGIGAPARLTYCTHTSCQRHDTPLRLSRTTAHSLASVPDATFARQAPWSSWPQPEEES